MDCPICDYKGIPDSASKCPKCNSDVTAFRQIYFLRDSITQKKNIIIALIVVIISMMAYLSYVFLFSDGLSGRYTRMVLQEKNNEIVELSKENAQLKMTLLDIQQKYNVDGETTNSTFRKVIPSSKKTITKKNATDKKDVRYHTVQAGETLYSIAVKYFHDGSKYKKIMKDNSITNSSDVKVGYKLKIILND